jgi:hypothetical protein
VVGEKGCEPGRLRRGGGRGTRGIASISTIRRSRCCCRCAFLLLLPTPLAHTARVTAHLHEVDWNPRDGSRQERIILEERCLVLQHRWYVQLVDIDSRQAGQTIRTSVQTRTEEDQLLDERTSSDAGSRSGYRFASCLASQWCPSLCSLARAMFHHDLINIPTSHHGLWRGRTGRFERGDCGVGSEGGEGKVGGIEDHARRGR